MYTIFFDKHCNSYCILKQCNGFMQQVGNWYFKIGNCERFASKKEISIQEYTHDINAYDLEQDKTSFYSGFYASIIKKIKQKNAGL